MKMFLNSLPKASQFLFIFGIILTALAFIIATGSLIGIYFSKAPVLAYMYGVSFWGCFIALILVIISYWIAKKNWSKDIENLPKPAENGDSDDRET